MKAVVWTAYGPPDLLRIADVEKPAAHRGQVLITVRAASVNPIDRHFMRGSPAAVRLAAGFRTPTLQLGRDVAGIVEAAGPGVSARETSRWCARSAPLACSITRARISRRAASASIFCSTGVRITRSPRAAAS
jgi:NADPH:quinone reductase-like Zn-dependent oxidoreductase